LPRGEGLGGSLSTGGGCVLGGGCVAGLWADLRGCGGPGGPASWRVGVGKRGFGLA
jgi:hypothetical protein